MKKGDDDSGKMVMRFAILGRGDDMALVLKMRDLSKKGSTTITSLFRLVTCFQKRMRGGQ